MKKRYTDVPFEVVTGPKPDVLPGWFKIMMYVLAALFLLGVPVWKFNQGRPTAPREAAQPAAPPAPSAQ